MYMFAIVMVLGVFGIGCFVLFKLYQSNQEFIIKVMSYVLLGALVIGLSAVTVSLGFRTEQRGKEKFRDNLREVQGIWGSDISQSPPQISYRAMTIVEKQHWKTGEPYKVQQEISKQIKIKKSEVLVKIDKDIRKKGLQLYTGYRAYFKGSYMITNPLAHGKTIYFHFPLPTGGNNINDAVITVNNRIYENDQVVYDGLDWSGYMSPGTMVMITISYNCQGLNSFKYALDKEAREIPDFKLIVDTDFDEDDINYIHNSMVHEGITKSERRVQVLWKAKNLITRQPVAISFDTGKRVDQIVARMYFYSPLAIFLFLGILLIFSIAYDIRLHFIHFLFYGLGFIFFYFFLSYIVSYIGLIPGYGLSVALSSGMLCYYAKILKRGQKLMEATMLGLAMFQVFFSFGFYFPLHTGFIILIGSAITLFIIMRATAGIEWKGKF